MRAETKDHRFYTLVLVIDFTFGRDNEIGSNKMFHDKMIVKMGGGMESLPWFLLGSWLMTLF